MILKMVFLKTIFLVIKKNISQYRISDVLKYPIHGIYPNMELREVLFQFVFSLSISIFYIIHVHIYNKLKMKGKIKIERELHGALIWHIPRHWQLEKI